jgi:hypothetical protein
MLQTGYSRVKFIDLILGSRIVNRDVHCEKLVESEAVFYSNFSRTSTVALNIWHRLLCIVQYCTVLGCNLTAVSLTPRSDELAVSLIPSSLLCEALT